MSKIHIYTSLLIALTALTGCSGNNNNVPFMPANSSGTASGVVSAKNFSMVADTLSPAVLDMKTNIYTTTDDKLTVYVGDRFNNLLVDSHTIYFRTDYGLLNPSSCVTADGTCTITWEARSAPDTSSTGDAPNGYVGITAYTVGEESFTDLNGNGTFDNGETFQDLPEPYVDVNTDGKYDAGDLIIDVPSALDPTGHNGIHDGPDGLFNGAGCTSTTQCSPRTTTYVFDMIKLDIATNRPSPRYIGGTINGLPSGDSVVLQDNGADNLTISGTGSPQTFTFSTTVLDYQTYTVTVYTNATTVNCTVDPSTATGTVSGSDVTTVVVNCV